MSQEDDTRNHSLQRNVEFATPGNSEPDGNSRPNSSSDVNRGSSCDENELFSPETLHSPLILRRLSTSKWVDKRWLLLTVAIHAAMIIWMAMAYDSIHKDDQIQKLAKVVGAATVTSAAESLFTLLLWSSGFYRDDRNMGPYVYAVGCFIAFPLGFLVCGAQTGFWAMSAQIWFGCLAPVFIWVLYAGGKFARIARRISVFSKVLASLEQRTWGLLFICILALNVWMYAWSLLLAIGVKQEKYALVGLSSVLLIWIPGILTYVNRSVVSAAVTKRVCSSSESDSLSSVFKRSQTSNAGTMCVAALILPLAKSLRTLATYSREFILYGKDHGQIGFIFIWCFCCLCSSLISPLVQRWKNMADNAIVHVSLYGTSFQVSARTASQCFRDNVWETIRDDPDHRVLNGIGSLSLGSLSALLSFSLAYSMEQQWNVAIFCSIMGLVIGFTNLTMINSVLETVDTTLLQYTLEDDSTLQRNCPVLHSDLSSLFSELRTQAIESEESSQG